MLYYIIVFGIPIFLNCYSTMLFMKNMIWNSILISVSSVFLILSSLACTTVRLMCHFVTETIFFNFSWQEWYLKWVMNLLLKIEGISIQQLLSTELLGIECFAEKLSAVSCDEIASLELLDTINFKTQFNL